MANESAMNEFLAERAKVQDLVEKVELDVTLCFRGYEDTGQIYLEMYRKLMAFEANYPVPKDPKTRCAFVSSVVMWLLADENSPYQLFMSLLTNPTSPMKTAGFKVFCSNFMAWCAVVVHVSSLYPNLLLDCTLLSGPDDEQVYTSPRAYKNYIETVSRDWDIFAFEVYKKDFCSGSSCVLSGKAHPRFCGKCGGVKE